jgi:urease accessory protein
VHRAASAGDDVGLSEIAELAAAFVPSRERQLETTTQGRAFIDIARSAWACEGLDKMVAGCGSVIVYPVAVGLVSAAHAMPVAPTMHAFLHALVSNWISAGARLVPLGQTDSQRILAALEGDVVLTARRALESSLDDHGSATFRADLASLRQDPVYEAVPVMMGVSHSPSVVPANAGTHNHRCLFCEERRPPQSTIRPRRMGPCVRRDDDRRGNGRNV